MEIQNIICFVFLVIISIFSSPATGHFHQQKLDRIVALPGQPPVSFAQYSGYVTVNKAHGRALFYWLTEATSEPEKKPLVLWLNGGPGCSSVAYGASEEIGPFRINKTGASLYLNKFSWNKEANILFLESPAGVGFSYTNTSSDLDDTGDIRTAQDSLHFIRNWFLRFPQYRYRDFYVTGESYAGHYVPQLVKQIQDYNKAFSKPYINLKGFMVGNAVFDDNYDTVGSYTFLWSHAMISDKTYESIMTLCDFSSDNLSNSCNDALKSADVEEGGYIDYYSVYTPKCTTPANTRKRSMTRFKNGFLRPRGYDPCVSSYAEIYYNRPDVQKAMHANTTGIEYRWTGCSDALRRWNDSQFSMLPTYKELMAYGLRIWVFSGDVDSVVPVTSTRLSLKQLNLTVKTQWYPWNVSGQVGGWSEVYDGLTFVTIRGSGHEVPLYQPRRGLSLFRSFLAGKEMPAFE